VEQKSQIHKDLPDYKRELKYNLDLAAAIGRDESIILLRILWWQKRNEKNGINFKNGRFWAFNPYRKWAEELGMSTSTVKRKIAKLRNEGLLFVGNFNKMRGDKTNWYSVNEERLNEICQINKIPVITHGVKMNISPIPHEVKMNKPIPVNNNYVNNIGVEYNECQKLAETFLEQYYSTYKKEHPKMTCEQWHDVLMTLKDDMYEYNFDSNEVYRRIIGYMTKIHGISHSLEHFVEWGIIDSSLD